MSDLDDKFDETVAKINAKLAEAAVAVEEANALSQKIGLPALIPAMYLREDHFCNNTNGKDDEELDAEWEAIEEKIGKVDVGALEAALSSAGWSTSGSYC